MTDCSMCGDCCENISLSVDRGNISRMIAGGYMAGTQLRDAVFIMDNMLPTGRSVRQGGKVKQVLACKKFDEDARLCTAHNERPSLCSRYPWYDKEPVKGDTTMGGRCSFLADAYKMLPIVSINGVSNVGPEVQVR